MLWCLYCSVAEEEARGGGRSGSWAGPWPKGWSGPACAVAVDMAVRLPPPPPPLSLLLLLERVRCCSSVQMLSSWCTSEASSESVAECNCCCDSRRAGMLPGASLLLPGCVISAGCRQQAERGSQSSNC